MAAWIGKRRRADQWACAHLFEGGEHFASIPESVAGGSISLTESVRGDLRPVFQKPAPGCVEKFRVASRRSSSGGRRFAEERDLCHDADAGGWRRKWLACVRLFRNEKQPMSGISSCLLRLIPQPSPARGGARGSCRPVVGRADPHVPGRKLGLVSGRKLQGFWTTHAKNPAVKERLKTLLQDRKSRC